jgi:hypothetical protein
MPREMTFPVPKGALFSLVLFSHIAGLPSGRVEPQSYPGVARRLMDIPFLLSLAESCRPAVERPVRVRVAQAQSYAAGTWLVV